MLSKEVLVKKFQKEPDRFWGVELFEDKGFTRKHCRGCGKFFWTLDSERTLCADSSCEPYSFIGNPITKKKWDYVKTWKEFEKFFKKEGHTSIPRYPVVDRWRPDLYFTIASIQDFQRIDKGGVAMEYPADPLIVPQVCLRFSDVDNVGVTGRHLTSFIMSGQHSFGDYWKDRCIELNFKFLNKSMGIPEKKLVYIEDLWSMPDFSQFGPSLETASMGLELVNSVFSQFTANGNGFKEMSSKVIDVGWGHGRLSWFSQGTTTEYEAVFGPVIQWLKKQTGIRESDLFAKYSAIAGKLDFDEKQNTKKIKEQIARELGVSVGEMENEVAPLQALYAIADHTKTLLFAAADGGIPSNVGGGYNLRVILRRALSFIREYGLDLELEKVGELHAKHLRPVFPELKDQKLFSEVIGIERERFQRSISKTSGIVERELKKGLDESGLVKLYSSHGITPETVEKAAKDLGARINIPDDFYAQVTGQHIKGKGEKKVVETDVSEFPDTKKLYYEDVSLGEMEAEVVGSLKGNWVVLDQTVFYPEGGGQPSDLGTLVFGGKVVEVVDVQKVEEVILHKVENLIPVGKKVRGVIDSKRRERLVKMHDATHIVAGACRKVLGKHVWQAGAHKGVKCSRLDVTHYQPFSRHELKRIEEEANKIVKKGLKINATVMERGEAEKKYGFTIYQGGASPGKEMRVVEIPGHDVEACTGTHGNQTSGVGVIKIIRSERIQDGVNRIEFTSGDAAKEYMSEMEQVFNTVIGLFGERGIVVKNYFDLDVLTDTAIIFSVDVKQLPKTIEKFLRETDASKLEGKKLVELSRNLFFHWKASKKKKERGKEKSAKETATMLVDKMDGNRIFDVLAVENRELIRIGGEVLKIKPGSTVILANQAGEIVGMSNTEDMGKLISELSKKAGGAGGGRKDVAQGKVKLSKLLKIMK